MSMVCGLDLHRRPPWQGLVRVRAVFRCSGSGPGRQATRLVRRRWYGGEDTVEAGRYREAVVPQRAAGNPRGLCARCVAAVMGAAPTGVCGEEATVVAGMMG
jgi:hypothetical protein